MEIYTGGREREREERKKRGREGEERKEREKERGGRIKERETTPTKWF